jgi:DNA-binding transcriptional regulator LsrR (DeoR family)
LAIEKEDESESFLTEVCWHYFISEMTQSEVADVLGVTRLRVNRAIGLARARGLVRVELISPFVTQLQLQDELRQALGLYEAIVVPANRHDYDYAQPVGAALAFYLERGLKERKWTSIGVSWGLTLDAAIKRLPTMAIEGLEIVSILGGVSIGASFNTFSVASGFAAKLGAKYSLFAAPIYLSPNTDREKFLSESVLNEHVERCKTLDLVILAASDLSPKSFLVRDGLPADVTVEMLAERGAIGDVLGRFFDKDGDLIDHSINSRVVGIELDQLENTAEVVLAAAGPHKIDIILACSRRGLIKTLITDDLTAELLLERVEQGEWRPRSS